MKPHAFVAMPFGTKPVPDSQAIDFNRVYDHYIKPALEAAGLEVFRADEEQRAGDIRTDMFQELLVADLVLADLTIDNPNVWYELGVRHALRARGVVLVSGGRVTTAFDLYTDRKLRYGVNDGGPDPASLEDDKRKLTEMVKATMESWHGRKVSPVFALLEELRESPWRKLLLAGHNEFSADHKRWERAVETAKRKSRPGDILVLADEAPSRALWLEAKLTAGEFLIELQQYEFALKQFDEALKDDPDDLTARQRRTICLGQVDRYPEARDAADDLIRGFPDDAENRIRLGRVEKDNWMSLWWSRDEDGNRKVEQDATKRKEMQDAAVSADASLQEAINAYREGFLRDPSSYYAGINAVTLCHLQRKLAGQPGDPDMKNLEGAVYWACRSAKKKEQGVFWARASLAQLSLHGDPCDADAVKKAYREAVAAADNSSFGLDSTRETLWMLWNLGYRPEQVEIALDVMKEVKEEQALKPRRVFLFSGHMVDAPDRPTPRFPAAKEGVAAQKIAEALENEGAGPDDLALAQAAAGGDLLFLEACRQRGVRCQILLPFEEPDFIQRSILPSKGGDGWRERFYALKATLKDAPRIMPVELGPLPKGVDPYERCNLWLLYTALACGVEKVRFVCLWNGGGGDGPGGTAHMYNKVKDRTGRVTWIDTRILP